MLTIIKVVTILLAILYIGLKINEGYKNAKRLESICTQIVDVDVIGLKKYHFLWGKYYQMECQYHHDGVVYTTKRGVFTNVNPNTFKAVQIHINPQKPTEVYYKSLNERCNNGGWCFVGCIMLFVLLVVALTLFVF